MKIYDCFQFFDEEMLLDLRLNIMNKYVDKFVITEATYMHNGKPKNLIFNIEKFSKFKDKIIYIVVDKPPPNLLKVEDGDTSENKESKLILNGYKRDNYQRQMAQKVLNDIDPEDWIIINDIDEIPNLKTINQFYENKYSVFEQKMFYYKFNLLNINRPLWYGSKLCKKKHLKSPQWLRNLKSKQYPFWRFDKKNINIIQNGGWHFSFIRKPNQIIKKIESYAHSEFNKNKFKDEKSL